MIKKLVKYGNSQALVLDKALLEILNISDATKLKLTTDGTSLTITPLHEETPMAAVSVAEGEAIMHYTSDMHQQGKQMISNMASEEQKQMFKDSMAFTESFNKKYNYFKRYAEIAELPGYKAEILELDQRALNTNMPAQEYAAETTKIMQKYMPDVPLHEWAQGWTELTSKYKS